MAGAESQMAMQYGRVCGGYSGPAVATIRMSTPTSESGRRSAMAISSVRCPLRAVAMVAAGDIARKQILDVERELVLPNSPLLAPSPTKSQRGTVKRRAASAPAIREMENASLEPVRR